MSGDTTAPEPSASVQLAVDELRALLESLRQIDTAAAAASWSTDGTLSALAADAHTGFGASDIDTAGARPPDVPTAAADAVRAVEVARAALADAVLAVWRADRLAAGADTAVPVARRDMAGGMRSAMRGLPARVAAEIRDMWTDRPRSILLRLVITLAISLSLVAFHHVTGIARYDDAGRLTLFLFSAVVGSVVCTNALCFDARRVRAQLAGGERLWRILITKNLALTATVTMAALPVIGLLTFVDGVNPVALIDQLVTMIFIWLGVGNVLSVVYPLRHEPVSARLHDGTWKPYLFSFALSYGVGLTVNLMIYWQLWAKQSATATISGGVWAAFALVLVSAVLMWILLTVLAVACAREPRLRRVLSRELVVYDKGAKAGARRTDPHNPAAMTHNPAAK